MDGKITFVAVVMVVGLYISGLKGPASSPASWSWNSGLWLIARLPENSSNPGLGVTILFMLKEYGKL